MNRDYLSFQLHPEFVSGYAEQAPPWGFPIGAGNSLGELTFLSKYSRRKPDGTKERWFETCDRVISGTFSILKDHCLQNRTPWNELKAQKSAQEAFDRMFNFKWLPPGRGIWVMGTEFVNEKRNSASLQNCAFVSTAQLSSHSHEAATLPFIRLMEMSMLGVGVGFDTKGAGKLTIHEPALADHKTPIEDSREGWYQSLATLLVAYLFPGHTIPDFDYSEIRPAGTEIKGFGGVAAGPGPLVDLHQNIQKLFAGRGGSRITSSDIVDIQNLVGKCVVSGNVRRSAEIALGEPDDKEFLSLKDWNVNPDRNGPDGWGHISNNSVFAEVGGNYDHLVENIAQNGEPGLLYLDLCREYGRLVDPPSKKDHRAVGTNPCSFAGETLVMTVDGPRRIDDLAGQPFWALVNGEAHLSPGGSWVTGVDDIYNLTTTEGYSVNLTGNHKVMAANGEWVEAQDLVPGDQVQIHNHRAVSSWAGNGSFAEGYLLGLFKGDGSFQGDSVPICQVWTEDLGSEGIVAAATEALADLGVKRRSDWLSWRSHASRPLQTVSLPKSLPAKFGFVRGPGGKGLTLGRSKSVELSSSEFHVGFLRGLFDADGHLENWENREKGSSVRLGQSSFLDLQSVQRMLLRLGIKSRIYAARPEGTSLLPDGKGGKQEYPTKAAWRLVVSGDDLPIFAERVGFSHTVKAEKLAKCLVDRSRGFYRKPFVATVADLEFVRRDDVWDLTVSDKHAFDANGVYVSNSEQTLESYECCTLVETFPVNHETLEDYKKTLKYAFMYAKAVTLLPTHWPETNEVMQRNRRIGCSVSGSAQFAEFYGWTELRTWLNEGYKEVQRRDSQYSEWLGVRESIKTTSVKPSGTVSLLAGVTPGVHWPVDDVYIRRMRLSKNDALVSVLEAAGYFVEPDFSNPDYDVVVELPTRGPQVRTEKEVSVWEKAAMAVLHQRYWADNQVSVTLSFREDERTQIGNIIKAFDGQLKSLSFLPILESGGAYRQMPYERIDNERYEELTAGVRPVGWSVLYGGAAADAEGEAFCNNTSCEIPR